LEQAERLSPVPLGRVTATTMESDPLVLLIRSLLAVAIAIGPGLYPALHLLETISPLSSRTQKIMLLPSLALMVSFFIAGWLVIIFGFHSLALYIAACMILNGVVRLRRHHSIVTLDEETPWQRLERMIEMGEIGDLRGLDEEANIESDERPDEEEADEDTKSGPELALDRISELLGRLPEDRIMITMISLTIILSIPLFSQRDPLGIDWIGFSTLTHSFAITGDASLPPPSIGRWTYPPAFPALAAVLQSTLSLDPSFAVHLLGQLSLLCVLFGTAGAMERFGAGLQMLLCTALAAGIFAKTLDSGYPTVASQLGLAIGLVVLIGPETRRNAKRDVSLALTVGAIGAIHPTGSIALGMLLLAHVVAHMLEPGEDARRGGGMVAGTSVVLGMAAFIVLGIFAPRLFEQAIHAEYGWQGGVPMVMWNSPLLILAAVAAWRLRWTMEGRIVGLWFVFQWLIASVHLLEGVVSFSIFTLLSYVLYSTAIHGFHIPLACLAALALSPNAKLTACAVIGGLSDEGERDASALMEHSREEAADEQTNDHDSDDGADAVTDFDAAGKDEEKVVIEAFHAIRYRPLPAVAPERITNILFVILAIIGLMGSAWLATLGEHPELFVRTAGDWELLNEADIPDDAVLYIETKPWGYPLGSDPELAMSSFPRLGLIELESTFESNLSAAIQGGHPSDIAWHGITHAISSPRGELGTFLARSDNWELLLDIDGSRFWRFVEVPTDSSTSNSLFLFADSEDCVEGCIWRPDPWFNLDDWRSNATPSERPYLSMGSIGHEFVLERNARDRWVRVIALVEGSEGHNVTLATGGDNGVSIEIETTGEMQEISFIVRSPADGAMSVDVTVGGESLGWLNPTALSGRGDRLIDGGGIWLHWVEVRPI